MNKNGGNPTDSGHCAHRRLRHQRFFSIAEVNTAIRPLLAALNARPFQKLPGSRQSVFEELDRPALRPLPAIRYAFAQWQVATAGIDYHVERDRHYYSVPYRYARQKVDVRSTATGVEVCQKGERLASQPRSPQQGRHTTLEAHQAVAGWKAQRFLEWAATVGPQTQAAIEQVLASRVHPQQGCRTALGILRLGKTHGEERLEAACLRAIQIKAITYRIQQVVVGSGFPLSLRRRTPHPSWRQARHP